MRIIYRGNGWFLAESTTRKGVLYWCRPKESYCTCPATKPDCKHINEIHARVKDNGIGIENWD